MCFSPHLNYQRLNVGDLNDDAFKIVRDNFDDSYKYELSKQPHLAALRQGVPEQIRADLDLGGLLRSDTQDAVARTGLNRAGSSGVIDSFSGRGMVAKDLGLTSEAIRDGRLSRAANYMRGEPLDYLGLTAGQLASAVVDDKVRDFQARRDNMQADRADLATNIQLGFQTALIASNLISAI